MKKFFKSIASTLLICALGAGVGLLAAHGLKALTPDYVKGDYSAQRAQTRKSVILLGTAWCGFCTKTREHLQSRGVVFADLDIEDSELAEQWYRASGAQGVPVVLIGDRQIRGFKPEEMDAAIAALGEGLLAAGSR
jgi:glutaredoxin